MVASQGAIRRAGSIVLRRLEALVLRFNTAESGLLSGRRLQLKKLRHPHQIGEGLGTHLLHDLSPVGFHCRYRNVDFGGACLFISPAVTNAMTSRSLALRVSNRATVSLALRRF